MKNIIKVITLSVSIISLASCSDFLNTESPSVQSNENVFKNEGMTRSAIMGIYSKLADTYVYGQKMSVNWQGNSDIEQSSGFSSSTSSDKTSDSGAANYWCDWYNSTVQWGQIYKLAELASTAVEGIRNSPILVSDSTVMKPYLGEALVLRSLAYFELVRRWGDVPFKQETSSSDLSNVYMGKIDRDSIYNCIIKDMEEAIGYLPWLGVNSDYNCERITKGFAKGLLARIALFAGGWSLRDDNQFSDKKVEHYPNTEGSNGMKEINGYYVGRPKDWKNYYAIAEKQCAEIIGDAANPHELDPDYGDVWKTVCGLKYNSYNENLFEVALGLGQSGDIGSLMGYPLSSGTQYGALGFGSSYVNTTAYYFYSFDADDKRRDYSVCWTQYNSNNKESLKTSLFNLNLNKWNFFWTTDAYKALHKKATSRVPTGINWILMRYSDVLLMFTEARYALEGENSVSSVAKISARQALEMVRTRAFGAGSSKITQYDSDFFQAIVNERAWEFGGESIRKLDLVRWGLLDTKIEAMKKALCLMMDGHQPVTIFDKTYQPTDFPDTVYYKFRTDDSRFIDISSINFYKSLPKIPDATYLRAAWFPVSYQDTTRVKYFINDYVKVLIDASGLRAKYDYSGFLSNLVYGNQVNQLFQTYITGNGVCNYRCLYPIYYSDIYNSNGKLVNSYGFDYK